jgi:hypothetical protein
LYWFRNCNFSPFKHSVTGLYSVKARTKISVSFPVCYSCVLSHLLQKIWFFPILQLLNCYSNGNIVFSMRYKLNMYTWLCVTAFKIFFVGYNAHCAYRNLWPGDYMWQFDANIQTQILWHPLSSSTDVKERVELYLYFPSGPSWPVLGWILPLFYLHTLGHPTYIMHIHFILRRFKRKKCTS